MAVARISSSLPQTTAAVGGVLRRLEQDEPTFCFKGFKFNFVIIFIFRFLSFLSFLDLLRYEAGERGKIRANSLRSTPL